jgi:hypothetical protein
VHQLRRTLLLLLFGLACAGLPQCSSGPALARKIELGTGQKVVIAYRSEGAQALSVINQSALNAADGAAARKADPNLKIIPDSQVQWLLDVFGGHGFFEAAAAPAGEGSRKELMVLIDGRQSYSITERGRAEHLEAWALCLVRFLDLYNANESFTGGKLTADDLKQSGRDANARTRSGKQPNP